jgi:hypothetical protein
MGKELLYKELLPNLRDLKLRSVVQTRESWLVEAGAQAERCVLAVEWPRVPATAATGVD